MHNYREKPLNRQIMKKISQNSRIQQLFQKANLFIKESPTKENQKRGSKVCNKSRRMHEFQFESDILPKEINADRKFWSSKFRGWRVESVPHHPEEFFF